MKIENKQLIYTKRPYPRSVNRSVSFQRERWNKKNDIFKLKILRPENIVLRLP